MLKILCDAGSRPDRRVLFPVSPVGASDFLHAQKVTKDAPGVGRGWLSAQRAGLGQSACTPGPPFFLRGPE